MNTFKGITRQGLDTKIAQLRRKGYFPSSLLDLLEEVTSLQLTEKAKVKTLDTSQIQCADNASLLQGKPLVRRQDIPFDADQATRLFHALIPLLHSDIDIPNASVRIVEKALRTGELKPVALFRAYLNDETRPFDKWAKRTPQAPQLVEFLTASALGPSLEVASENLSERLPETSIWPHGTCPICGSLPLISSLRNKEGARYMTCSFCHHDYRVHRLACPVCGEHDHAKLKFFTVDAEPGFRVDVCETCNHYIKTIDFRTLDRIELPLLDDLDSLVLDHVAQRSGFKRPTMSAWRF